VEELLEIVPIKNVSHAVRDMNSKAIIIDDHRGLIAAKERKRKAEQDRRKLDSLEKEVSELKGQFDKIVSLLEKAGVKE